MERILVVSPVYLPFVGGTTAFIEAVSRRLVLDGHHVTVLTTTAHRAADFWQPPEEPPLPSYETLGGIEVERLPITYPRPIPYVFGLLRRSGHWLHRSGLPAIVQRPLLRRPARAMPSLPGLEATLARLAPSADLIQAEDSSWDGLFTAAAGAACRYRRPFVAHPLMHLGDASVRAHFQMAHQVDVYRAADAVLALSQREADEYGRLGVARERIHLIAMGVETAATFEVSHDPESPSLRQQVVFLGANTYDKGAFTLALAAAELNRAGLPLHVAFAGPGSEGLKAFLARQPADIRSALADRVQVLGLVDEPTKHRLLASSTLLALPSQVDTFGIVFLEAWLHAKPVIGAEAGGIPDLVHDGENGLLVPFGDVAALAAAVRSLVEGPDLAARLGGEGRRQVLERYTWEQTYRTLTQVYTELVR